MSHSRIVVATLLTISCIFSANAQTAATPTCQSLSGMTNITADLLAGIWYEEFRAPAVNVSCVHANVTAVNNQTQLNVTLMYSASRTGLIMDQFASTVIDINGTDSNDGFTIKYNNSDTPIIFKILSTDYISNVVLCGYTNVNDSSTSFGIIATRKQIVNETWLMQLKNDASQTLPVFNSTLAANITQSLKCKPNSAASPVPALATLLAAFYILVRLAH